jgi:hypothetical protein
VERGLQSEFTLVTSSKTSTSENVILDRLDKSLRTNDGRCGGLQEVGGGQSAGGGWAGAAAVGTQVRFVTFKRIFGTAGRFVGDTVSPAAS